MTGLSERLLPPESAPYPGAHLGVRWRPLIPSDGQHIAELIRNVEDYDGLAHRTSAREIVDFMQAPHGQAPLDVIVGVDSSGKPSALAVVRVISNLRDLGIAVINAFVSPKWRGRGIGRALLYWQDARARQMLVEQYGPDSEVPAAIVNIVDSHMTDRRRLYIAAGFYARRTFTIMYREIEGSEAPPPRRDGYEIRRWRPEDTQQALQTHMEVFVDHVWPELRGLWWDEAMDSLYSPWSFTALDPEGKVVGYVLVGRPDERCIAEGRLEAYIELVGVARKHRGRGLTSALLSAATAAASRGGARRIGLDVDTHGQSHAHQIYEHLGFVDDHSLIYYTVEY